MENLSRYIKQLFFLTGQIFFNLVIIAAVYVTIDINKSDEQSIQYFN